MVDDPNRGRNISAEEYLGHVAYAFLAAPADTPEESVAKAHLELACERLGMDPQDVVNQALGLFGKIVAPWETGSGVPAGLIPAPVGLPERSEVAAELRARLAPFAGKGNDPEVLEGVQAVVSEYLQGLMAGIPREAPLVEALPEDSDPEGVRHLRFRVRIPLYYPPVFDTDPR